MENLDNPHTNDAVERLEPTDPPRTQDNPEQNLPPEAQRDEPWPATPIDPNPTLAFEAYENVPTQPLVDLKGVEVNSSDDPLSWKFHQDYGSQRPEAVQLGEHLGDWAQQAGMAPNGMVGKLDTIAAEVNRQGLSQEDAVTALGVAMDTMHPGGGAGPVFEADNGSLVMKAPGLPAAYVIDRDGNVTPSRFRQDDPESPLSRF
jgi:hypothetical protein